MSSRQKAASGRVLLGICSYECSSGDALEFDDQQILRKRRQRAKRKCSLETNTGKTGIIWLLRLVAAAIAVYGAFLFGQAEIYRNMFLQNEFAILDF